MRCCGCDLHLPAWRWWWLRIPQILTSFLTEMIKLPMDERPIVKSPSFVLITRGQWPYRLRSTRALTYLSSNFGGFRGLGVLQTAPEVQIDLRFETSNLDYPGIRVHIASEQQCWWPEAMVASKRPLRTNLTLFEISSLDYQGIHVHIAS